jgi:hypothetical protein
MSENWCSKKFQKIKEANEKKLGYKNFGEIISKEEENDRKI